MMRLTFNSLGWHIRTSWLVWMLAALYASPLDRSAIAQSRHTSWLTGPSFARQIQQATDIHWQDAPLRASLQRLGQAHRVAIILDRRIDPGQSVSTSIVGASLIDSLQSLAESNGWRVSVFTSALYIGPDREIRPLATWQSLQEAAAKRLARPLRKRWLRPVDASWPELSEPRSMIQQWLQDAQIPVIGLEQIPHDLWPQQDLPRLHLLDRLIVTLAGFQLAPEIQPDGQVRIIPLPADASITKSYRVPDNRQIELTTLQEEIPEIQATLHNRILQVVGRIEHHQRVTAWLQGERPQGKRLQGKRPQGERRGRAVSDKIADKRFTLTVQNQRIDAIVQTVARQLNLQVDWRAGTEPLRQTRVSLSVKNATLDQLITSVLADQRATFQVQAQTLIVSPTEPPR